MKDEDLLHWIQQHCTCLKPMLVRTGLGCNFCKRFSDALLAQQDFSPLLRVIVQCGQTVGDSCFRLHWPQQTIKNKQKKKKKSSKPKSGYCTAPRSALRGGTLWSCSVSRQQVSSPPAWRLCSWHPGQQRTKSDLKHTSMSCYKKMTTWRAKALRSLQWLSAKDVPAWCCRWSWQQDTCSRASFLEEL